MVGPVEQDRRCLTGCNRDPNRRHTTSGEHVKTVEGGQVAEVVTELERSGYDGWYVLEQDAAITDGEPAPGEGPKVDVLRSIEYLRAINAEFTAGQKAS